MAGRKLAERKPPKRRQAGVLTRKQRCFLAEYLSGAKSGHMFNGAQAAIVAGCSPKSAPSLAYHWMRMPAIQKELNARMSVANITPEYIEARIRELAEGENVAPRDQLKALELLGKCRAMFTDKVQHTGEVSFDWGDLADRAANVEAATEMTTETLDIKALEPPH